MAGLKLKGSSLLETTIAIVIITLISSIVLMSVVSIKSKYLDIYVATEKTHFEKWIFDEKYSALEFLDEEEFELSENSIVKIEQLDKEAQLLSLQCDVLNNDKLIATFNKIVAYE